MLSIAVVMLANETDSGFGCTNMSSVLREISLEFFTVK